MTAVVNYNFTLIKSFLSILLFKKHYSAIDNISVLLYLKSFDFKPIDQTRPQIDKLESFSIMAVFHRIQKNFTRFNPQSRNHLNLFTNFNLFFTNLINVLDS